MYSDQAGEADLCSSQDRQEEPDSLSPKSKDSACMYYDFVSSTQPDTVGAQYTPGEWMNKWVHVGGFLKQNKTKQYDFPNVFPCWQKKSFLLAA